MCPGTTVFKKDDEHEPTVNQSPAMNLLPPRTLTEKGTGGYGPTHILVVASNEVYWPIESVLSSSKRVLTQAGTAGQFMQEMPGNEIFIVDKEVNFQDLADIKIDNVQFKSPPHGIETAMMLAGEKNVLKLSGGKRPIILLYDTDTPELTATKWDTYQPKSRMAREELQKLEASGITIYNPKNGYEGLKNIIADFESKFPNRNR